VLSDSWPRLLEGAVVTLQLAIGGSALALPLALCMGLGRSARQRAIRLLALGYVEFFRGTSALIQLYWVYFALPLLGVRIDALSAGIVVLGCNAGAYGAEVVRGAIAAVPRSQWEAGAVLGLPRRVVLWRIILPEAVPRALPPLNNVLIELLKNTALASMITLSDLTFEAQALRAASLRSTEIFGLLLALYFGMSLCITAVFSWLERLTANHLGVDRHSP
jgi:polar amino acid transport system permease protein